MTATVVHSVTTRVVDSGAFHILDYAGPLATLAGATAAICVALVSIRVARASIRAARDTARLKATLDLIEKSESSDFYLRINTSFSKVRREALFGRLDDPNNDADKALRVDVGAYLNHYELVAIGIEGAILDDAMYRTWMAGAFVRDWNAAADWIQRERWRRGPDANWIYRADLYAAYQRIARRWSTAARDLVEDAPPVTVAPPPGMPVSLGDEPIPDTSRADTNGDEPA